VSAHGDFVSALHRFMPENTACLIFFFERPPTYVMCDFIKHTSRSLNHANLSGSLSYIVTETFGWKDGLDKKFLKAKAFYAIIACFNNAYNL